MFQKNDVILFQGDSITDAGRDHEEVRANTRLGMGTGYALIAGSALLGQHPSLDLQVYNRGIGGDIVKGLDARWQSDCLDLKPNLLSILIGINDTAKQPQSDCDSSTLEVYDQTHRKILDAARQQDPELRIVICEPFALRVGNVTEAWLPGLTARQRFAKQIAADYDATWIGFQQMFDDALKEAPAAYWIPDGVHPTPAGHYRMARMWLDAVESE